MKAVQALAVGEPDDAAGSVHSLYPFLSPLLTPSLSFAEFSLVCAHLLVAEACRPIERTYACVTETAERAHSVWSEKTVEALGAGFSASLMIELGLSSNTSPSSSSSKSPPPFLAFWRLEWVDLEVDSDALEMGDEEGSEHKGGAGHAAAREQMLVPSCCTASLSAFLFALNQVKLHIHVFFLLRFF